MAVRVKSVRTEEPMLITWQGGISADWNEALNWDEEVPLSIDTVVIPRVAEGHYYPVLTGSVAVSGIRFEPGAQIGSQHWLAGKAFIQYDLNTPNRWHMLSVPLGQVFPGDFTFAGYPVTWVRTFEMREATSGEGSITKGTWVTARGSQAPFRHGDGFVLWLDEDNSSVEKGLKLLNGIRELPFFDHHAAGSPDKALYDKVHQSHDYNRETGVSTFYNYVLSGGEYVRKTNESYTVLRKDSAYLLAGANLTKNLDFGANSEAGEGGIFALVGNPYMAVLDYKMLYDENSSAIKNSYHIWTGLGYTVYTPDGTTGIEIESDLQDQLIAPLQSFIVEKGGAGSTLGFREEMTAVNRLVSLRSGSGNKLDIVAGNPVARVRTYIAKREGGQDTFGNMDSRKVINEIGNIPEIYTLKPYKNGMIATSANIINSDDMLIPVGLATSYTGNITLSFSGMDTYDADLSLIDAGVNKSFDLTGLVSFDYVVNYTPKEVNGKAAVCEDRFFIRISRTVTGLPEDGVSKVNVYRANGLIHIVSGASNPIREVSIYSLQGTLLHKENAIDAISHTINRSWPKGVYIVKVVSEKNIDNVKLIIY